MHMGMWVDIWLALQVSTPVTMPSPYYCEACEMWVWSSTHVLLLLSSSTRTEPGANISAMSTTVKDQKKKV